MSRILDFYVTSGFDQTLYLKDNRKTTMNGFKDLKKVHISIFLHSINYSDKLLQKTGNGL